MAHAHAPGNCIRNGYKPASKTGDNPYPRQNRNYRGSNSTATGIEGSYADGPEGKNYKWN